MSPPFVMVAERDAAYVWGLRARGDSGCAGLGPEMTDAERQLEYIDWRNNRRLNTEIGDLRRR